MEMLSLLAGRWREKYDEMDHRRSGDLLAAFGVGHLADRTFGTLSEGERKTTSSQAEAFARHSGGMIQ